MARVNKKRKTILSLVDRTTFYPINDAVELARKASTANFNESVDIAIKLGVDPKHADQMVRGSVTLPNGLGKTVRVLVFAKGDKATEATAAGADVVGAEELVQKIQDGFMDFDKVVATPDLMAQVGKLGKVLGPRGLMPNPKVGTVTTDIAKVVTELKSGMVEFRVDKNGIAHVPVGRKQFSTDKLVENIDKLIEALMRAKPISSKGQYVRGVTVSTTMGIGVRVDHNKLVEKYR